MHACRPNQLFISSTQYILYSTCHASPQSRSESHLTLLHTSTGTEKFLYSHMTRHSGRDYCSCRDHLNIREGMYSSVECVKGHTYYILQRHTFLMLETQGIELPTNKGTCFHGLTPTVSTVIDTCFSKQFHYELINCN